METLIISPELVGHKVRNAARPEWGTGVVLRVQAASLNGECVHRISIQFANGHHVLMAPPARLIAPTPEPQRSAGWLENLGKTTLDDRLRSLPPSVVKMLGSPRARLAALIPYYAFEEESESLLRWAREQTGVRDPLSQWTRDELSAAWQHFCAERDAHFRAVAASLKLKEGDGELRAFVDEIPENARDAVRAALRMPV